MKYKVTLEYRAVVHKTIYSDANEDAISQATSELTDQELLNALVPVDASAKPDK